MTGSGSLVQRRGMTLPLGCCCVMLRVPWVVVMRLRRLHAWQARLTMYGAGAWGRCKGNMQ